MMGFFTCHVQKSLMHQLLQEQYQTEPKLQNTQQIN